MHFSSLDSKLLERIMPYSPLYQHVCGNDIKTLLNSRRLQIIILSPFLESSISWPQSLRFSSLPVDLILKGKYLAQREWFFLNIYSPLWTRGTFFINWSRSLVEQCSFVVRFNISWGLHGLERCSLRKSSSIHKLRQVVSRSHHTDLSSL